MGARHPARYIERSSTMIQASVIFLLLVVMCSLVRLFDIQYALYAVEELALSAAAADLARINTRNAATLAAIAGTNQLTFTTQGAHYGVCGGLLTPVSEGSTVNRIHVNHEFFQWCTRKDDTVKDYYLYMQTLAADYDRKEAKALNAFTKKMLATMIADEKSPCTGDVCFTKWKPIKVAS